MEYEKKQRIYKTIMLVILVAVITFIVTTVMLYNKIGGNSGNVKYVMIGGDSSSTSLISRLKNVVDKYYLGDTDEKKMSESAAKGYIEGLEDEYSEYITAEEYAEFSQEIYGSFVGIGIYFGKNTNDEMMVVSTIENSAAEKAGLQSGDIITKVDDYEVTTDSTTSEVSAKIKGEEGTKVKMEILREGEKMTFEITRENVKLHYVKAEILDNNIGYITVSSFDEGTADEFKNKLEELQSKNVKSLIIDLRNNGGGIVQEATQIADYLLDKDQKIIITKDKQGKEEITLSKEDKITDLPVVVLVNGYTASSSEILASALKDNNRAKVVGTKTYGKGVIQNVYRLTDGSALKLTTHEYYTAIGNKINKLGITPTEEVELPDGVNVYNMPRDKDTQLKKAIELLK